MIDWAKTFKDGKFARYIDAKETLKLFYAKFNKPTAVEDVQVEEEAILTLTVVNELRRKSIMLCDKCGRKICGDDCGAEEYSERYPKAYKAADHTGTITVSIAPWSKLDPMSEDETYVVEGMIAEYRNVKELRADKITAATEEDIKRQDDMISQQAKKRTEEPKESLNGTAKTSLKEDVMFIKDGMSMYDGEVPDARMQQIATNLTKERFGQVVKELNLVCKDGTWRATK